MRSEKLLGRGEGRASGQHDLHMDKSHLPLAEMDGCSARKWRYSRGPRQVERICEITNTICDAEADGRCVRPVTARAIWRNFVLAAPIFVHTAT